MRARKRMCVWVFTRIIQNVCVCVCLCVYALLETYSREFFNRIKREFLKKYLFCSPFFYFYRIRWNYKKCVYFAFQCVCVCVNIEIDVEGSSIILLSTCTRRVMGNGIRILRN